MNKSSTPRQPRASFGTSNALFQDTFSGRHTVNHGATTNSSFRHISSPLQQHAHGMEVWGGFFFFTRVEPAQFYQDKVFSAASRYGERARCRNHIGVKVCRIRRARLHRLAGCLSFECASGAISMSASPSRGRRTHCINWVGFGRGGYTTDDVQLMRCAASSSQQVGTRNVQWSRWSAPLVYSTRGDHVRIFCAQSRAHMAWQSKLRFHSACANFLYLPFVSRTTSGSSSSSEHSISFSDPTAASNLSADGCNCAHGVGT
ncbi:hypothetical protein HDK90DRAFT_109841 [Phyllosticta capitalensis]|uniref:Uncharacterized protein n=1 Tax=Phyllosticta capitalensis TaxID=121624 RepID=A0ABR1YCJ8_9PEZI